MSAPKRFFVVAALGVLGVLGCGSRTGLFADEFLGSSAVPGTKDGSVATDAGTDGPKPLACTPGSFALGRATAQVVFVLDRSGSMQFTLQGDTPSPLNRSRWQTLQGALAPVLTALEQNVEIGAKFFPDPVDDDDQLVDPQVACAVANNVDVAPVKSGSASILKVFDTTTPRGGTPTANAIEAASKYLSDPARRSIARYMVLATDGAPNCNGQQDERTCVCTGAGPCSRDPINGPYSCLDDTRTIDAIRKAQTNLGIATYVLGLGAPDRPEFTDTLERMAVAGGRSRPGSPRYYDVRTGEELGSALSEVQKDISRCAYVTPSRPNNPDAIDIVIDGRSIPRDPTRQEGWDWTDRDFGAITFFGKICTTLSTSTPPPATATVRCD
jgi:hypothetical protein